MRLILIVIGVCVFCIFQEFAALRLNTADSSIYLSTAENIAHHKGLLVSYNLCQSFKGLYHPLLAYYQPLYSILCSVFIAHGGIVRVIQVNILFLALNTVIILYLIQKLVPTRFNVFFIFFLVFSVNFFNPALYPWTEQFHFFCLLTAVVLFIKYSRSSKCLVFLGALNAVFMLVRVAHMYNFLAFVPVLLIGEGSWRQRFQRTLCFVGGFAAAYMAYQFFCVSCYHAVYPEYAKPGAGFGMAHLTGGTIYQAGKVGIQSSLGPLLTQKHLSTIIAHLQAFYNQMPFLFWPALLYVFLPASKRQDGGVILLCLSQSICTVLGYSLTFYWLPSHFESLRYSLIPYVFVSIAGWYALYQGLLFLEPTPRKWFLAIVLSSLVFPQVNKFIEFKADRFLHPMWGKPYYSRLLEADSWIDQRLPKEVLIASDEEQEGYFMHRPFISLPPGRSYNCTNLSLYNHIYAPDYYLLSADISDKCFATIPHTAVYANKTFRILKAAK